MLVAKQTDKFEGKKEFKPEKLCFWIRLKQYNRCGSETRSFKNPLDQNTTF